MCARSERKSRLAPSSGRRNACMACYSRLPAARTQIQAACCAQACRTCLAKGTSRKSSCRLFTRLSFQLAAHFEFLIAAVSGVSVLCFLLILLSRRLCSLHLDFPLLFPFTLSRVRAACRRHKKLRFRAFSYLLNAPPCGVSLTHVGFRMFLSLVNGSA